MPGFLEHHPGFLFVIATLLPMASFVLILLSFAVPSGLRKSPEGSPGETIYQLFGGAKPGRVPAYVATAAIGLAFVCSLVGFVLYVSNHAEHAAHELMLESKLVKSKDAVHHLEEERELLEPSQKKEHEALTRAITNIAADIKLSEDKLAVLKGEWSAHLTWASVGIGNNEERGG